jgi:large subunit ribosomal protein L44
LFSAEQWAASQPASTATLDAFSHRVGLASILPSRDFVAQACTHPSFTSVQLVDQPLEPPPPNNGQLAELGNSLLGMFATEHIHASFPHLPTRVVKAAVSAYVGTQTCAAVAKEMGATPLLRWNRTPRTIKKDVVLHPDALASIPRALTALIYHHRSIITARKFVHAFFLSRDVDLRSLIKFRDPKLALSNTVDKFGRERPVSRLLKETGRASNSPVFVVGIYSGADQLGEGFGSSLKMAEFRAAEDALHRLYLTRTPPDQLSLPSSAFPSTLGSVFQPPTGGPLGKHVPGPLGASEVLFGARQRAGTVTGGRKGPPTPQVEPPTGEKTGGFYLDDGAA